MLKRRLAFLFLLLAFATASAIAPSLAFACPHMEKQKQESTVDSDCPMHKKQEEKKIDTSDKPCCNSASCKVPQTSFLNNGHYQHLLPTISRPITHLMMRISLLEAPISLPHL
ncbi:MAG: hypothetical protein AB7G06_06545, partial [Bdellovibrionales bacterium]